MTTKAAIDAISRTRLYRGGRLDMVDFPVADVSDYIDQPDSVVWIDLCGPSPADVELVGEELGLHKLAVEDAIESHQRPKLDRYADHQLLNMYGVTLESSTGELRLSEITVFLTRSALVTIRKDDLFDIDDVIARWDNSSDLAECGVGFLLYGLVDHVVDGHFDAVQTLDDEIEGLEDVLFGDSSGGGERERAGDMRRDLDVQRRSYSLRKSLVKLRRVVLPMREVVNTLMRRDLDVVHEDMTPYFQDVYDHVLRATEWTESLRDLVGTIFETNLSIQSNRLNIITKQVTSWAAIIAVPTAITGFYGQNLPYPGFAAQSGFIWSCLLIVALSGGLYAAFRHRGWL